MKSSFASYHPVVSFIYFFMVIFFSMFIMQPVCLFISLMGSMLYFGRLKGMHELKKSLGFMIPMMLLTALVNPLFNHGGITILWYFPSGNPLTAESVFYGIGASAMLISVIMWFSCFNMVITSDKIVYLFGRVIPSVSLILSMTLRLVPRLKEQMKNVMHAQEAIGNNPKGLIEKIKYGVKILSIMITWMLENGIETADSMKSRGYGLKGRTSYSIYNFDTRDKASLSLIFLLSGAFVFIWHSGKFDYRYFPSLKGAFGPVTIAGLLIYFIFCTIPFAIEIWEDIRWKHIESGI